MADKYNSRYSGTQIDNALEKAMGIDQSIQDALGSFTVQSRQIQNGAVTYDKLAAELKKPIMVREFSVDNISVSAGGQGHADITPEMFTVAGYTPVGFVNIYKLKATTQGANETKCVIGNLCFYGGNWRVSYYNTGSSAAKIMVVASLLYVKDELLDMQS